MRIVNVLCILLAVAALVAATPNDNGRQLSEIKLVSPNGERTILITAADTFAGVWITNRKTGKVVAMISTNTEWDAGFGIYNDVNKSTAFDACLWAEKDGGHLQMYKGEEFHSFTADDFKLPKGLKVTNAPCACSVGGPCCCQVCDCPMP
jgi:hypothetical protein